MSPQCIVFRLFTWRDKSDEMRVRDNSGKPIVLFIKYLHVLRVKIFPQVFSTFKVKKKTH